MRACRPGGVPPTLPWLGSRPAPRCQPGVLSGLLAARGGDDHEGCRRGAAGQAGGAAQSCAWQGRVGRPPRGAALPVHANGSSQRSPPLTRKNLRYVCMPLAALGQRSEAPRRTSSTSARLACTGQDTLAERMRTCGRMELSGRAPPRSWRRGRHSGVAPASRPASSAMLLSGPWSAAASVELV